MRISKGSKLKVLQGRKSSNGHILYPDDVFEVISKNDATLPDEFIHGVTSKWSTIQVRRLHDGVYFYVYPDVFVQFEDYKEDDYSIF